MKRWGRGGFIRIYKKILIIIGWIPPKKENIDQLLSKVKSPLNDFNNIFIFYYYIPGFSSESDSEESKAAATAKAAASDEKTAAEIWSKPAEREEEKSRDDVFNEFLEDLFV